MNTEGPKEEAIFAAAIHMRSPAERAAYLKAACGTDNDLLRRVEALIQSHEGASGFLNFQDTETTGVPSGAEKPGTVIGPYKLLQQIGEGGFGVVYMAEQQEPVRRRVALKIIKPGMDTRVVVARFEAERQTLAMMDHPNIARVIDVGTTQTGLPYFVMELVKGVPITAYCDERRLTPRQRLELMVPICQAVQHAHQKGIVHRDLKPSNILVAEYDDQAVPKIIDFGVAKALNQTLTEKTMFTEYGQVIGTIEYMSPEQARFNQLDVDTRTDIYSLGVLLYELLTGTTPFEKKRLRAAAFDELMRIIREEDPPRPSVRLSTVDTLPIVAAKRQSEPKKLRMLVRGELDWIVMKAMEKDRARRYDSATGLAEDVRRYLQDEPVAACPPSAAYRFRKFTRRHKTAIATGTLVTVTLLFGVLGTSWQAYRATSQRDLARLAEAAANAEAARRETAEVSRRRAERAEESAIEQLHSAEAALREAKAAQMATEQAKQDAIEKSLMAERAKLEATRARDEAVASERRAKQNEAAAIRERELAERERLRADDARRQAELARIAALSTAERARETEEVIAQLVRALFAATQNSLQIEQNLNMRYDLHWAMAALARVNNNREQRIANLRQCVQIATDYVRPLETQLEQDTPLSSGVLSKLLGDLSVARSRLLRAERELTLTDKDQVDQAALKRNVLNHLTWWRQVDEYMRAARRGGEAAAEADARCRLFLAVAEAVAGGTDLGEFIAAGSLPAEFAESRADPARLYELAVAAGEEACEAHRVAWTHAGDRLALLPRIADALTELSRARIALAQLNSGEADLRGTLESHAAALQQYYDDLQSRGNSALDQNTRSAASFVLSQSALVELQLLRLGDAKGMIE